MTDTVNPTLALTKALIAKASVTPQDAGCQDLMASRLAPLGFNIEPMFFVDTQNMWARKGNSEPVFCFAGHTDVVPSGPADKWHTPPFEPTELDGKLFGRGAADMKGALAAMVVATERFVEAHPDHKGSIAFLITSDEEGPFINGTVKVVETLQARNEKITWCVVGEPSSSDTLGDIVKVGRRGSFTGHLTVHGVQGHVAYPHLASNAVHVAIKALDALVEQHWDKGNDFFPPTTMQISNISAGSGATNVIPGELDVCFNFRYSSEVTHQQLQAKVEEILTNAALDYDLNWTLNGLPFLTGEGELVHAISEAVEQVAGFKPQLLTTGGTSDGRFIAPTGAQVVELGPCNGTIHKVNEFVNIDDLEPLAQMYQKVLEQLLL